MKTSQNFLESLIEKILKEDDESAFATLFNLFYARLVNYSVRIVRYRYSAEEIVSSVFVKIWQSRKIIGPIGNVEAYLYSSVRNSSLNFIKAKYVATEGLPDNHETNIRHFAHPSLDPEMELEMKELQTRLSLAIETLPSQCKSVFKLIKEDGLKYKEVADILNISTRTVETHLVRALKRLESEIAPYLEKKKGGRSAFFRIVKCLLIMLG